MKVFEYSTELTAYIKAAKTSGKKIGFVPTMGALHEGHMSLINASKAQDDITVCSIFVNPTQFDESRDLSKYPRTAEADLEKLKAVSCDVAYVPSVEDIYPNGKELKRKYKIGRLEEVIEGASRPGHYQGVAQVVHRLLDIVTPHHLYLGQKDFQQVKVLTKVINDLPLDTQVVMCPILREPDGLAMSSRNVRLAPEERIAAVELSKTISKIKTYYKNYGVRELKYWGEMNLDLHPLISIDYLKFCDADSLKEIQHWNDAKSVVILGAIRIGEIRLIDNMIIF